MQLDRWICVSLAFSALPAQGDLILGSDSTTKLRALEEAMNGEAISIRPLVAASDIAEQPVSRKWGIEGARNRLRNLPVTGPDDLQIAVENFVDRDEQGVYDQAVVLIGQNGRQVASAFSPKVYIPAELWDGYKQQAGELAKSGYANTFGEYLASKLQTEAGDWHQLFGGHRSRQEILTDTIKAAWQRYQMIASMPKVPDFPREGILFHNFLPLLEDPKHLQMLADWMVENLAGVDFDAVAGLESRGFLVGMMVAIKMNKGFIAIRKSGKLPPPVLQETYDKEYGKDTFEVDAHLKSVKVLLIDDLLATGGSLKAAENLIRKSDCEVVGSLTLVDLGMTSIENNISLVQL